jgi:uncharacterized protein
MMKKIILSFILLLTAAGTSLAQKAPFNVVFDVTTKDTVVHQMVIRWVKEISTSYPDANVEVVFYAKSLDMITKDKSVVADDLVLLAANKKIAFNVCEVALKNNKVEKSDLLQGVGTVPDGIYEIVSKQHEGWGYIKASR